MPVLENFPKILKLLINNFKTNIIPKKRFEIF